MRALQLLSVSEMLKGLVFIFIFSAPSVSIAQPYAPKNHYMMVYRYHGSTDFKSARLSSFGMAKGGFEPLQIGTFTADTTSKSACRSLLTYSQSFPLSLMQSIDYISNEQVLFQKNVENQVVPEQITFSEISTLEEKEALEMQDGQSAPARLKGHVLTRVMGANSRVYRERKKTAMWLVSGQTLKAPDSLSAKADMQVHNLPWQNDPDFLGGEHALDREKYKFVWELGRSGQVQGQRLIIYNMTALILAAYKERKQLEKVAGTGGAYVFAHALDASHTRLFERIYGGRVFATDRNNSGNNILIMSLDSILVRYPISKLSQRVSDIKEISAGALNDLQAIDLLDMMSHASLDQLDLVEGSTRLSEQPIVVENYALAVFQALLEARLSEFDLDPQAKSQLYYYLANQLPGGYKPSFAATDFASMTDASRRMGRENGVLISNLDSARAKGESNYLSDVLSLVRRRYQNYLQAGSETGERNLFRNGKLSFYVRTTKADLAQVLVDRGGKLISKYPNQDQFTIYFDDSVIDQMATENRYSLKADYWNFHGLLSRPLEF